jgi:magnesium transporter
MIAATFTGQIITSFENVLGSVVILTSFIPMLMNTGGSSGSQASTLVIRGLATGEIEMKDVFKVIWKEFRISLLVGITLAIVNFARLMIIEKVEIHIALTVSLTLIVTIAIAKIIGSIAPLAAKKLKLDPAIMAGPLITTFVDAVTLTVYFSFASILLRL